MDGNDAEPVPMFDGDDMSQVCQALRPGWATITMLRKPHRA